MKKLIKKLCACILMSFLFIYLFICSTPVKAATLYSIQPYAYYSTGSFKFTGSSNALTKNYDGTFMAIEATATSSSGNVYDVNISVFISSLGKVKNYTVSSNGSKKKFDFIFLGLSGSSDVSITCSCNSSDTITMELITYSW